ncbi:hypothetical protein HK405_003278 [Cladochytrium tenue]|nr:hypothetical protein HK405_003278 [Cladochytrium tenue]
MRISTWASLGAGALLATASQLLWPTTALAAPCGAKPTGKDKIAPKFFIISMFSPEAEIWYENLPSSGLGDLMAVNVTIPGLSMLFPYVHCTADGAICQVTTGEAEINAASTIMALGLSDCFDLTKTYFMIAGIAGVNPARGTLGGVALSRYAVQVALQYEFDAREMPANFSTGYWGFGTYLPNVYPTESYGTEVFEVNEALRQRAYGWAKVANLSDSDGAVSYRARYAAEPDGAYAVGAEAPAVVLCDTATSDVYYSGDYLGVAFDNVTTLWTNGTGEYCMTAQEDNGTLEVLIRLALEGMVDFSRIIIMRTGSDFDRPPPGISAYDHLLIVDQNGFEIAIENIYNAGVEIVKGILAEWDSTFEAGIEPGNYIGDIFGSLGGEPDFGLGSTTDGAGYIASDVYQKKKAPKSRRDLYRR